MATYDIEQKNKEVYPTILVIKYLQFLAKKYNLNMMWLFGSYLKGVQNENSDIDIIVSGASDEVINNIWDDIYNNLGKTSDILNYDRKETIKARVYEEAISYGKRIW